MEFKQVQYFLCLYQEGSVSKAAKRLNIVAPALSMQVTKLEDELGRQLFVRGPKGMEPTSDGRRMFQLFEPHVRGFAQARKEMASNAANLSGEVRIGAVGTIAQGVLIDVIGDFCAKHPRVSISITDGYGPSLVDAVADGRVEAAIVNKMRMSTHLSVSDLMQEELLVLTGPRHRTLGPVAEIKDVASLKLALPTLQDGIRGLIQAQAEEHNVEITPIVQIDSIPARLRLVSEQDFATILPRGVAALHAASYGLNLSSVSPNLYRSLVIMTHPHRTLAPQTAAFLDLLVESVNEGVDRSFLELTKLRSKRGMASMPSRSTVGRRTNN